MARSSTSHGSKVTAAMVARDAGVSIATVSLVVNGKAAGRVSTDVVDRVQDAVTRLGYVVDQSASQLSSGSSRTVILVAPDLSNPYFATVISGVQDALAGRFQLLLSVAALGAPPRSEDVKKLLGLRTAGFLVGAPSPEFLAHWSAKTPTVLIDAAGLDDGIPSVNLDVVAGAKELAGHLVERGHRRAAYLDSQTPSATFTMRRAAFEAAAALHGLLEVQPHDIVSTVTVDDAARAFRAAWPRWKEAGATVVVCSTDVQAYGVLLAAGELGLSIPGDIAVTGYDDLPFSRVTAPSLTTVSLPGYDMGNAAAARLLELIDNGPDSVDRGNNRPVAAPRAIPSALVVRSST